MPAFVSPSNSNSWPPVKSFRVPPHKGIGWTCQIESLEGRDQMSVLLLWSWSRAKSKQGRLEGVCSPNIV